MTETKSPRPRAPELYGIPEEEIARICGVHVRTARRWKQGIRKPPATALMILARDHSAATHLLEG